MILKIRYNLWKAKRALKARAAFKLALWQNLEKAWSRQAWPDYRWYQKHLFRFSAAMATAVLLVGSFVTGAYAYNDPTVTEGTALYPVKQAIEGVVEKLQRTPEAKARFYLKKIHRYEAEQLVQENRNQKVDKVVTHIKETEDQLEKTDAELKPGNPEADRLHKKIVDRLGDRKLRLENSWAKKVKTESKSKNEVEQLGDLNEVSSTPKYSSGTLEFDSGKHGNHKDRQKSND